MFHSCSTQESHPRPTLPGDIKDRLRWRLRPSIIRLLTGEPAHYHTPTKAVTTSPVYQYLPLLTLSTRRDRWRMGFILRFRKKDPRMSHCDHMITWATCILPTRPLYL